MEFLCTPTHLDHRLPFASEATEVTGDRNSIFTSDRQSASPLPLPICGGLLKQVCLLAEIEKGTSCWLGCCPWSSTAVVLPVRKGEKPRRAPGMVFATAGVGGGMTG